MPEICRILCAPVLTTRLPDILSKILLAIDSGNFSFLYLMDLSSDFDTADHSILPSLCIYLLAGYRWAKMDDVQPGWHRAKWMLLFHSDYLYLWHSWKFSHGTHFFLLSHNVQAWSAWSALRRWLWHPDFTDVQHLQSISVSFITNIADCMKCNQLIEVRISLVLVLTQGEQIKSQHFHRWCRNCRGKERGSHTTELLKTSFAVLKKF